MKIVLCGSKKFIPKFLELKELLTNEGDSVVIPREFIEEIPKKEASLLHFKEIDRNDVDALLIVNEQKGDIENYIGANGFAELAFGFYKGKTIYLLNDIFESYSEELLAWQVIPLKGNLNKIEKNIHNV